MPFFPPPSVIKVDVNASSPTEFSISALRWRSCAYLNCICSCNPFTDSFYSSVCFRLSMDAGLLMCMIALLYMFSFHRTCFFLNFLFNGVPITVSSKNHILFYKKVFTLHVETGQNMKQ